MEIRVHLIPDHFHLTHVGELHDGNYFWIDNQLASDGNDTRDFIAVYIFDRKGNLIDSKIIDRGLRSNSDQLPLKEVIDRESKRTGVKRRTSFWAFPFSVAAFGLIFGLVVRDRQAGELDGYQAVDVLPGYTLMFYPPWSDGLYDT